MRRNDKKKTGAVLKSGVYYPGLPLPPDEESSKQVYLFQGITRDMISLSCHVSRLSGGASPHDPHIHKEEEVLIMLRGKMDIILPGQTVAVKKGDFLYYPSGLAHTLRAGAGGDAEYLIFKWSALSKRGDTGPGFDVFALPEIPDLRDGFARADIFDVPTLYLRKLHCHISRVGPGAGYEPHSDHYDVAMVVLEGELETLGRKAGPHDVIFYAPGEAHGIKNTGDGPVSYLVFEFHANNRIHRDIFIILSGFMEKVLDPGRWKRKLKKVFIRDENNRKT
jgi:quercetin dioxygenase-like cupin family protein